MPPAYLTVCASSLISCSTIAAGQTAAGPLGFGDGADWSFVGGAWKDGQGRYAIPEQMFSLRLALYRRAVYGDVTVECDLDPEYRAVGGGDAGIIIRARDARHYYWIHEPWVGQTTRAKHFWLAISKVDATGWVRHLRLEVVPGVPSEMDRWYRLRVEARGPAIRTWVDGYPGPGVTDDTYATGAIGIGGYGWFHMKNLTVQGRPQPDAAPWQAGPDPGIDWFHVLGDAPGAGTRQKPLSLRRLPDDTLVFQYGARTDPGWWVSRSKDGGLSWDQPTGMPRDRQGFLHVTHDGRLLAWQFDEGNAFWFSESTDRGRTWGPREAFPLANPWPDDPKLAPLFYGKGLYELPDGTWVVLLHGNLRESEASRSIYTWGHWASQTWSIRSTDQGRTWSAPVNLDGVRPPGASRGSSDGCLDMIEPVGAYTRDGRFLVYCRPIYSPTMWQAVSTDGGRSWDAAARGPFPGYAADMWCTAAGALLVSHRFPDHTINLSLDNGRTWDAGTTIDFPLEGAGKFAEVAPDVLLFIYRNDGQTRMRAQYLRVSPGGLVKLPRDWQAAAQ